MYCVITSCHTKLLPYVGMSQILAELEENEENEENEETVFFPNS
jgi:hypothetical protein